MARAKRTFRAFNPRALPPVQPPSEADMIEEGILVGEAAARLDLRNRMTVAALRDHAEFDPAWWDAAVRRAYNRMATQADRAAKVAEDERLLAQRRHGPSQHEHDFRRADLTNLDLRVRVNRAVGARLRALGADPAVQRAITERVRDEAWKDVSTALEHRIDDAWPRLGADPEYVLARNQRVAELAEDLARAVREPNDAAEAAG